MTVFFVMCTAAPNGRMNTAATRSLEMAVDGLIPKSRISIGVISAPPPAPVSPTRKPTTALPSTMYGSMCTALPSCCDHFVVITFPSATIGSGENIGKIDTEDVSRTGTSRLRRLL